MLVSFPAVILVTPAFPGLIVLIAAGSLVDFLEPFPLLLNLLVTFFLLLRGLPAKEQKEQQAKERKRKNDLKKAEDEISRLEDRNAQIDHEMTLEEVYSNSVKCQELTAERAENEARLEELYELWETLAE